MLNYIDIPDKGRLFYMDFGGGGFNRPLRVWISAKLVEKIVEDGKEYYRLKSPTGGFPLFNAKLVKGRKSWIIKPGENLIFKAYQECGYRGSSSVNISEAIQKVGYSYYHSPRGSLGVSSGALFEIPRGVEKFKLYWTRSGRTYGAPKEGVIYYVIDWEKQEIRSYNLDGVPEDQIDELVSGR